MQAIHVTDHGDPNVLEIVEIEPPEPKPGEIRIDVEAIGVNFADIKRRSGTSRSSYPIPSVPGIEASGIVDKVTEDTDFSVGDRVVAYVSEGAYAEYLVANSEEAFSVPEAMSLEEAAGVPVQFITAYNALHGWGDFEHGDRVLIHAAAGGVGSAAVQLADHAGAEVFATASTEEKRALARDLGADHTIDYTTTNVEDAIYELTDGEGVDIVLDGVGGEAFEESLEALAHFGRIVSIGSASGEEGLPNPSRLRAKNASVIGYHLGRARRNDPESIEPGPSSVFELLALGTIDVLIGKKFPLSEAASAHKFIQSRDSTGKVLLIP